jgi:hypothetical protein
VARDVVGALPSVTDRKAVKRVQLGGLVLILGVLQATRSGKRTSLKKKKNLERRLSRSSDQSQRQYDGSTKNPHADQ